MIAYKAVSWYGSPYFESWTVTGRSKFLRYVCGQEVQRPATGGPLACFERVHQAARFISDNGDPLGPGSELILRVEVIERSAEKELYLAPDDYRFTPTIEGTIFVDRLKVLGVLHPRYVLRAISKCDRYVAWYQTSYNMWQERNRGP